MKEACKQIARLAVIVGILVWGSCQMISDPKFLGKMLPSIILWVLVPGIIFVYYLLKGDKEDAPSDDSNSTSSESSKDEPPEE